MGSLTPGVAPVGSMAAPAPTTAVAPQGGRRGLALQHTAHLEQGTDRAPRAISPPPSRSWARSNPRSWRAGFGSPG